jgi:hypothetical protein
MDGQGPRSGARDNGLRCANYVAIGDLDPRVADALLETFRSEGIAAYVTPTPATRGGYLETRPSSHLTDRLYADAERAERAHELLPPADATPEIDFDSAWQQVLSSLQSTSPSDSPVPPWPVSEDVDPSTTQVPIELPAEFSAVSGSGDPALDDHFVPPPPPPLPKLRRVTALALLAIIGGILVLATQFDDGAFDWLAILAILGGGGALVWHMKEGPPTDSGWDDGAVV